MTTGSDPDMNAPAYSKDGRCWVARVDSLGHSKSMLKNGFPYSGFRVQENSE